MRRGSDVPDGQRVSGPGRAADGSCSCAAILNK